MLSSVNVTRKLYEEAEPETFRNLAGVPIFLKDLGQEQAGEINSGSRLFTSYRAMKRIIMLRNLRNWALLSRVLALSLASKTVMLRFMVLSIYLMM